MADEGGVVVQANESGPYLLKGPIRLLDCDGNPYDVADKSVVALCRCGGSHDKPFCDGTHASIGFVADERATEEEPEGGSAP